MVKRYLTWFIFQVYDVELLTHLIGNGDLVYPFNLSIIELIVYWYVLFLSFDGQLQMNKKYI